MCLRWHQALPMDQSRLQSFCLFNRLSTVKVQSLFTLTHSQNFPPFSVIHLTSIELCSKFMTCKSSGRTYQFSRKQTIVSIVAFDDLPLGDLSSLICFPSLSLFIYLCTLFCQRSHRLKLPVVVCGCRTTCALHCQIASI